MNKSHLGFIRYILVSVSNLGDSFKIRKALSLCVATFIAMLGIGASAEASERHALKRVVRCNQGMSVQRILDRNFLSLPLKLLLVGPCPGFTIRQNDVSIAPLNDGCPGATVNGGILMVGAFRIEMRCITVSNVGRDDDERGIELVHSRALLEDVEITGNADAGLEVTGHSTIEVIRGLISGNATGVVLDSASSASFDNTHIRDNIDGSGVNVVQISRLLFEGGSITGNQGDGISLELHSTAEVFGGAQITGNAGNNISVNADSGVQLNEVVNGVVCDDPESSVRPLANAPGTNCTDF